LPPRPLTPYKIPNAKLPPGTQPGPPNGDPMHKVMTRAQTRPGTRPPARRDSRRPGGIPPRAPSGGARHTTPDDGRPPGSPGDNGPNARTRPLDNRPPTTPGTSSTLPATRAGAQGVGSRQATRVSVQDGHSQQPAPIGVQGGSSHPSTRSGAQRSTPGQAARTTAQATRTAPQRPPTAPYPGTPATGPGAPHTARTPATSPSSPHPAHTAPTVPAQTPRRPVPPPRPTDHVAELLLLVLSGQRPVHSMLRHTVGQAYDELAELAERGPLRTRGPRPVVRDIGYYVPRDGAVEAFARIGAGDQLRAMAFRLELGRDHRWRCTAVELGGPRGRYGRTTDVRPHIPAPRTCKRAGPPQGWPGPSSRYGVTDTVAHCSRRPLTSCGDARPATACAAPRG
jgi:hypothetical protein